MSATVLQSATSAPSRHMSKSVLAGRIMSGIAVAFMLFDSSGKILRVKEVIEGTQQLNFDPSVLVPLGLLELTITLLYLVPRFAPLGATLLTGYLGGAVAIHVQLGNPVFTHLLFPIYIGVLLWGGLYLRDARVRAAIAPMR